MEKQKYYITTAIAYTSGKPHIGNTYEVVLADSQTLRVTRSRNRMKKEIISRASTFKKGDQN